MINMSNVTITTFTDPMMGLSYECEPVFRRLETHFKGHLEFKYVMSVLVRDVSAFMTQDELRLETSAGIQEYCKRLARIYKSEESISGMPVNMDGFHLFDAAHRSSLPLNIAYKAAQITDPGKADTFLYDLRYATIVETKQTTSDDVIMDVAKSSGLDMSLFANNYYNGYAEKMLHNDLQQTRSLGISTLPAYLIEHGEQRFLIKSLIGYDAFVSLISDITDNGIKPKKPQLSDDSLKDLFRAHPLMSSVELQYAFDEEDPAHLMALLDDLVHEGALISMPYGYFKAASL